MKLQLADLDSRLSSSRPRPRPRPWQARQRFRCSQPRSRPKQNSRSVSCFLLPIELKMPDCQHNLLVPLAGVLNDSGVVETGQRFVWFSCLLLKWHHKLVSRPRPRTFKTKTETLGIKTKTKTLKIGSRDVSRPRLKSRELQVWQLDELDSASLCKQHLTQWPSDTLTTITARTPVPEVTATRSSDFVTRSLCVNTLTKLDTRRTIVAVFARWTTTQPRELYYISQTHGLTTDIIYPIGLPMS